MKSLFKKLLSTSLLYITIAAVHGQDHLIKLDELPLKAKQFIKQYKKSDISFIKMEKGFFTNKTYEVKLKDGSEFEFDGKGDWKEIDLKLEAIPLHLIPNSIQQYIKKSFPKNNVVKISKESNKYEIELSNGLDLEFSKSGKFIAIDD